MPISGAFIVPHPPIILPAVGKGEEKRIQKTIDAYRETARRIARLKPDTIILTSPHSINYADYFHISPGKNARGDMGQYRAASVAVSVDYDAELAAALADKAQDEGLPAGALGERNAALDHATIIPLAFIQAAYENFRLVRIGLSGLPYAAHYRLGMCIAEVAEKTDKNIVLVASGDLSHKVSAEGPYGFAAEGVEFDRQLTTMMAAGDFLGMLSLAPDFAEKAAECGLRSFLIMAGALDGREVAAELLSYEDTFGVGYAVASFIPGGRAADRKFLDRYLQAEEEKIRRIKAEEDAYVRLARYAVERYVAEGKRAKPPETLPEELTGKRAGVFVSLKKQGNLRGCIGTISPVTGSVAAEILRNAVSACAEDPRFDPVTPDELPQLVYSVDVLSPAEPATSAGELDVKRYGVIVTSGHKRGLLLPDLEGVDTVEQQIAIACGKAGIRPDESYSLERFEVVRHR